MKKVKKDGLLKGDTVKILTRNNFRINKIPLTRFVTRRGVIVHVFKYKKFKKDKTSIMLNVALLNPKPESMLLMKIELAPYRNNIQRSKIVLFEKTHRLFLETIF